MHFIHKTFSDQSNDILHHSELELCRRLIPRLPEIRVCTVMTITNCNNDDLLIDYTDMANPRPINGIVKEHITVSTCKQKRRLIFDQLNFNSVPLNFNFAQLKIFFAQLKVNLSSLKQKQKKSSSLQPIQPLLGHPERGGIYKSANKKICSLQQSVVVCL